MLVFDVLTVEGGLVLSKDSLNLHPVRLGVTQGPQQDIHVKGILDIPLVGLLLLQLVLHLHRLGVLLQSKNLNDIANILLHKSCLQLLEIQCLHKLHQNLTRFISLKEILKQKRRLRHNSVDIVSLLVGFEPSSLVIILLRGTEL